MNADLKYIGANIREARQRKGLTLEVLSGLAGISESFLGMAERGSSCPSLETLLALCDALDLTPNDLLVKGRVAVPRPSDKCDTLLALVRNAPEAELDYLIGFVKHYRSHIRF
jgi:transcriptional regulator with XRE-family HTH domain